MYWPNATYVTTILAETVLHVVLSLTVTMNVSVLQDIMARIVVLLLMHAMEILVPMERRVKFLKLDDLRKFTVEHILQSVLIKIRNIIRYNFSMLSKHLFSQM